MSTPRLVLHASGPISETISRDNVAGDCVRRGALLAYLGQKTHNRTMHSDQAGPLKLDVNRFLDHQNVKTQRSRSSSWRVLAAGLGAGAAALGLARNNDDNKNDKSPRAPLVGVQRFLNLIISNAPVKIRNIKTEPYLELGSSRFTHEKESRAEAIANKEASRFDRSQKKALMRLLDCRIDRAVPYWYLPSAIPPAIQRAASHLSPTQRFLLRSYAIDFQYRPQSRPTTSLDKSDTRLGDFRHRPYQPVRTTLLTGNPDAPTNDTNPLDFPVNDGQSQQLRQVAQQQRQMLEPVLQQLRAGHPRLAKLISDNPKPFLEILSAEVEYQRNQSDTPPIFITEDNRDPTKDERYQVERLCRLGFDRDAVACDKNEELAANFLFGQPEEDLTLKRRSLSKAPTRPILTYNTDSRPTPDLSRLGKLLGHRDTTGVR